MKFKKYDKQDEIINRNSPMEGIFSKVTSKKICIIKKYSVDNGMLSISII